MSTRSTILKAILYFLAPFILIVIGVAIAAGGVSLDWQWLFMVGLSVAGIGILWIVGFVLMHGPADWLN